MADWSSFTRFDTNQNVRVALERILHGFNVQVVNTYSESRGQATTQTMPCPIDQANQAPSGEKSTLQVSHPARPTRDGGRLVFSSRIRAGSDAGEGRKGNINSEADRFIASLPLNSSSFRP